MDNCPRCEKELMLKGTEYGVLPQCIYCGYEDYSRLEMGKVARDLGGVIRDDDIERKVA